MEIKTKYDIGDTVTLKASDGDEKLRVTRISLSVHKDKKYIAYSLEAPTGENLGYYAESFLTFVPETVDKTQCTAKVTIDIKDVYGAESIEIPKGYRFKRFGSPVKGELVMLATTLAVYTTEYAYLKTSPRIIVDKIQ